jgi:catalase
MTKSQIPQAQTAHDTFWDFASLTELCAAVAAGLGLPVPTPEPADVAPSPALSQLVTEPGPIAGRVVGVVAGPKADLAGIAKLPKALKAEGAVLHVIAPVGGVPGSRQQIVERTLLTTRSIQYDAVLIAGP